MNAQTRLRSAATHPTGAGAVLIGIKEAAELVEVLDWPHLTAIPPTPPGLAAAAALAFTVLRMHLTERALHFGDATE